MILASEVAIQRAKEKGHPFIGKLMIAAQLLMFLSVIAAFIIHVTTKSYIGYGLALLIAVIYGACGLYLFFPSKRDRNDA